MSILHGEKLWSKFLPGDVILTKASKGSIHDNLVLRPFLKGYKHAMFYYGKTLKGIFLGMEVCGKGAQINTLEKQLGQKAEVYRINHQYSEIFAEAALKAGEELVDKDISFFDYLAGIKAILSKFGIHLRIKSKYYPCYVCSEFVQVCFEDAVNYLKGDYLKIYKTEILSQFPRKFMLPIDFSKIPVLKKIWEGTIKKL